jgi:hypothetical protein
MEIIWVAIVIYSAGLAAVLYLRPALMFNENGKWKEFGYNRDSRHTIFPFWLFAIVWAFLSYALAAAGIWYSSASASVASASSYSSWFTDDESEDESEPEENYKEVRVTEKKKPRPGYYVLNSGRKKGIRKYVYYGQEPPAVD